MLKEKVEKPKSYLKFIQICFLNKDVNINQMKYIILYVLLITINIVSFAQKKQKLFKDTLDNAFDISNYMYNLHGLLPIIAPITEPAVGFGASIATVYFIPKKPDSSKFQMPDIAALAGGLTENGTWFAGGAYLGFWNKDKIRYRGIFGYGDIKLKYYGKGSDYLNKNPLKFSLNSTFLLQQVMFRICNSRFMIGGKYIFTKTNIMLFDDSDIGWLNPQDIELKNSGIGIIAEYENYDNILSPNKGIRININYFQSLELLGGDLNFGRGTFFLHYYIPLFSKKIISAYRIESQIATGNNPFYMNPFIYARGIAAMRYQGDITALVETEQLFSIYKRWSIVGFAGTGITYNLKEMAYNSNKIWNFGGGFRYLIARKLGLKMGVDLAKSPDNWGIYIIFGTAWIK